MHTLLMSPNYDVNAGCLNQQYLEMAHANVKFHANLSKSFLMSMTIIERQL